MSCEKTGSSQSIAQVLSFLEFHRVGKVLAPESRWPSLLAWFSLGSLQDEAAKPCLLCVDTFLGLLVARILQLSQLPKGAS